MGEGEGLAAEEVEGVMVTPVPVVEVEEVEEVGVVTALTSARGRAGARPRPRWTLSPSSWGP